MKWQNWLTMGLSFYLSNMAYATDCEALFSFTSRDAASVWLSGSFTDWAPRPMDGAIALTRQGDTWTVRRTMPAGKNLYKFIVNGTEWVADPFAVTREADAFGGFNSVYQCGDDQTVTQPSPQCRDSEAFDWRDTVMYFALVDRFADSDGMKSPVPGASGGSGPKGASAQYEGGDFQGLTQKIPYLTDLGVTSLWLSAPFENRNEAGASVTPALDRNQYSAYHGYWPSPAAIDYSDMNQPNPRPQVESRYGTEADLKSLIQTAHGADSANQKGIRVLFDYVMKHVDINSGLYKAHPEWFSNAGVQSQFEQRLCGPDNLWDDPYWMTRCSFTSYLPSFDFYRTEARRWSVNDAIWWAKEYGIDGLRLDAVKHVPLQWLQELRQRVKETFPDPEGERFYLVGETFDYTNRDKLKNFVDSKSLLDGQFDFPFKKEACQALFTQEGNLQAFANWLQTNDRFYDRGLFNRSLMVNWIGNHDVPRAIHFASRQLRDCTLGSSPENGWSNQQFQQPTDAAPYERLALAFAVIFTNPGIPLVYYGDEIGMAGGGDPDNRRMMVWDDSKLLSHQIKLREQVKKLAQVRARFKNIGRGQRKTTFADRDGWVYTMSGCEAGGKVTVAINKSDAWKTVPLPGDRFTDLMDGQGINERNLSLPPRSFRVLQQREASAAIFN